MSRRKHFSGLQLLAALVISAIILSCATETLQVISKSASDENLCLSLSWGILSTAFNSRVHTSQAISPQPVRLSRTPLGFFSLIEGTTHSTPVHGQVESLQVGDGYFLDRLYTVVQSEEDDNEDSVIDKDQLIAYRLNSEPGANLGTIAARLKLWHSSTPPTGLINASSAAVSGYLSTGFQGPHDLVHLVHAVSCQGEYNAFYLYQPVDQGPWVYSPLLVDSNGYNFDADFNWEHVFGTPIVLPDAGYTTGSKTVFMTGYQRLDSYASRGGFAIAWLPFNLSYDFEQADVLGNAMSKALVWPLGASSGTAYVLGRWENGTGIFGALTGFEWEIINDQISITTSKGARFVNGWFNDPTISSSIVSTGSPCMSQQNPGRIYAATYNSGVARFDDFDQDGYWNEVVPGIPANDADLNLASTHQAAIYCTPIALDPIINDDDITTQIVFYAETYYYNSTYQWRIVARKDDHAAFNSAPLWKTELFEGIANGDMQLINDTEALNDGFLWIKVLRTGSQSSSSTVYCFEPWDSEIGDFKGPGPHSDTYAGSFNGQANSACFAFDYSADNYTGSGWNSVNHLDLFSSSNRSDGYCGPVCFRQY